ncbi:MAG: alcohol dehydrogenase catalytic domain-containing protein [Rhodococcus sp.]|nr:alcohol dehydrogenase catalytic domain-containing protein [Rhodococcus sp. (in: high G+C Gram-positive bacteria)]
MKAWMLDGVNEPFRLTEVDVPAPGTGQVQVKVRAAGLCHSDVGVQEGVIPTPHGLPMILGHEASGIISAVGDGVTDWKVGDAVVVAGFGTTTTGAIEAVKRGGRIVLVGLGRTDFPFESFEFVMRNIDLRGASSMGEPEHLQAVIDMISAGDLTIQASQIEFDEIADGLERLKRGEVTGRLFATLPE